MVCLRVFSGVNSWPRPHVLWCFDIAGCFDIAFNPFMILTTLFGWFDFNFTGPMFALD